MKKIVFICGLVLLLYLSLFPRMTEVVSGNYLFGFDQGRDYLAAWNIGKEFKPTLIGSEFGAGSAGFRGLFHGPFHYYFLALFVVLFNGNPYGGIVLMFLFSISTILLGFFVGFKIYHKYGGLLTALLIAISPPLISAGRFVWNSNPSPVFILGVFYFVYKGIAKRGKYIFLSSFLSAFIYNFQTGIAVPLSLTVLVFYIFVVRLKKIKEYVLLFSGFLLAITPFFLFELRHSFMGIQGMFQYVFKDDKTQTTSLFILRNLHDHFNTFIYSMYDTFPKQDIIPSIFVIIFILVSLVLVFIKDKNKIRKKFILFLLLQPFISFFVFSFLKNSVYPYYLLNLNLVYIFVFCYVLVVSFELKNKIVFYGNAVLFGFFILCAIPFSYQNFINDYNDYGGDAKIQGKIDAIDYIYKDANGKEFGLLVFSPPVYTYPYDYLIKWYADSKYGYTPHSEKKGTYYLLIEKDPSKPWSYEGWLETVIGDGTVIEEKILPSGFIIQKRSEK